MPEARTQLRAVVVDDDADVRLLLRRTLEMQGFAVSEAASGEEALGHIKEYRPDIVTLDLNLPDLDGMEICRQLRKFSDAYVFMITARSDEIDELIGLEAGADDYISKPFSPRTVQARVAAALRRHRPTPNRPVPQRRASDFIPVSDAEAAAASNGYRRRAGDVGPAEAGDPPSFKRRASDADAGTRATDPSRAAPPVPATAAGHDSSPPAGPDRSGETSGVLRHGPLAVEVEGRIATLDGIELVLTRTEFDLLEALTGAPRRVWTRKALLTKVWGSEWATDEHLVEVHIGNLRRKLGDQGREPRFIRTVRGIGYRMAPAEDAA